MLSNLGTFSSLIALAISFALIIFSYFEIKISDNKVKKKFIKKKSYKKKFYKKNTK